MNFLQHEGPQEDIEIIIPPEEDTNPDPEEFGQLSEEDEAALLSYEDNLEFYGQPCFISSRTGDLVCPGDVAYSDFNIKGVIWD